MSDQPKPAAETPSTAPSVPTSPAPAPSAPRPEGHSGGGGMRREGGGQGGGGGLGDLIARGLAVRDTGQILLGALPVVALALLIEAGLGRVERRLAGSGA